MKRWTALTALIFIALSSVNARALVVVGQNYEPYYFHDGTSGINGACYEIVQRLCSFEKAHCKFKFAPVRRFMAMLKTGEADVGCPLGRSAPRETAFHMHTLFRARYAFFGLPEATHKIKSYTDLNGLKVGVLSPAMTEISLQRIHEFTDKAFTIEPEKTIFNSLLKAKKKAYALAYGNRDVALRWIEKTRSKLREVPELGEPVAYSIAFSKKNIDEKRFQKIQQYLSVLHKDGTLEQIARKYRLTPAEHFSYPQVTDPNP
ncbi:substrate-binding periplasmic protein [Bdellovibrio bacteriovorus]|uniref:substrate-binding periplasmic protein n=1 Tax=Bdellovibrio bacteriovorus TaxID=959 RepID=UPI0035A67C06